MDIMGFHIVDVIIVGLIAFLAIKGLVNGFTKELLNFITIVGGVLLAARYNEKVVALINEQQIVPMTIPDDFSKLIGFIVIVISMWIVIGFISSIITRLTSEVSGFFSRLIGYILSAARYIFIFTLIIFGISQSDFFKESATKFKTETQLFEPMAKIGAEILNLDANNSVTKNNNSTSNNETDPVTESAISLVEHNTSE